MNEAEAEKVRPPAVVKTLEQRLQELSAREREALGALREKVRLCGWYDAAAHDDWTLLRYLTARNFDGKKALKMLESSAQWRATNGVDSWVCEACAADPNGHMMQFVGWDLSHRPVCFMSMRWGPDRKEPIRHTVCAFNHLVKLMPVGVDQWVCITDFETYSHLRDSSPRMASTVISTIQDHFPERLGLMILVNPPKIFSFLWKLISPVVDARTKSKVRFVYTNSQPNIRDEFAKLFPPHLCDYLCESYRRSRENVLPASAVWYPEQEA